MRNNKLIYRYLSADVISAIIVWVLFIVFRKAFNDISILNEIEFFVVKPKYYLTFVFFPFVAATTHYLSGFYLKTDKQNSLSITLATLFSAFLLSVVVFFFFMIDDIRVSSNYYYISLSTLFILFFVVTLFFRILVYKGIQKDYTAGRLKHNILIIGTGKNAHRIAGDFFGADNRNTFIGYVQVDNASGPVPKEQICGHFNQIDKIIEQNHIDEAIIALDDPDELKLFSYINTLYRFDIGINFTPRLYEILTGSARISSKGIQPLVSLTDVQMPSWQIAFKRILDIALSASMLLLLLPLFIYFALAIKANSKGPVFYKQERIGRYGKPFNILKFRTMYVDAENGKPMLSSPNDERITSIGRILRKYRIDELPQFWNILRGDMSIVGPRPERKYYINKIIEEAPYYCLLYKIRPGLTSWGPIKIGYSDTVEKMIERLNYDIIYIENMSLMNDMRILIYTIEILLKGKGM